jgi:DNA primase catalytic subunit
MEVNGVITEVLQSQQQQQQQRSDVVMNDTSTFDTITAASVTEPIVSAPTNADEDTGRTSVTVATGMEVEDRYNSKPEDSCATTESTTVTTDSPTTSLTVSKAVVTPYHTSSACVTSNTKSTSTSSSNGNEAVTPQLLSLYYQHLFPYDFIYNWFRYGTHSGSTRSISNSSSNTSSTAGISNLFLHREFSFTIQSNMGDEIYIRYQSYSTLNEFKLAIQKRCPIKIDIGALFSHPPTQKHTLASSSGSTTSTFQPLERELVFDIDLTDYDDVRNCGCQNANICSICWKYMYMAMNCITTSLREDFDFQHMQWFYSGRRGIHCWVCDPTAKSLTDQGRTAIANYLTVRNVSSFWFVTRWLMYDTNHLLLHHNNNIQTHS